MQPPHLVQILIVFAVLLIASAKPMLAADSVAVLHTIAVVQDSTPTDTVFQTKIVEGITGSYPNPMFDQGRFTFVLSAPGKVQFSMHGIQGKLAKDFGTVEGQTGLNSLQVQFESNEIAEGIYIMKMVSNGKAYFFSFMVLH